PIEDRAPIATIDHDDSLPQTDAWCREFLAGPARGLTHLVSIERPGPSHTLESLRAQPRETPPADALFAAEVPERDRNRCHNMLGDDIDCQTAKAERLFELIQRELPEVATIGIGDGGNEIGMGTFAWETLRAALGSAVGGRVVSRIATRYTLLAGVSDWAAYVLALGICSLRDGQRVAAGWNTQSQRELIEMLVSEAGAVDGVTGRPTATVDGLELDTYLAPLAELRRQCGM
ncbi:MAG TPA: glutamate cyclase domain-containing protein, partial [Pirellulales bacterium]